MALPMYTQKKKKRELDPNAPPRPTLLGHEKEMKTWRTEFTKTAQKNTEMAITIATLERKVNRLQSQVDGMASFINRINRRS